MKKKRIIKVATCIAIICMMITMLALPCFAAEDDTKATTRILFRRR